MAVRHRSLKDCVTDVRNAAARRGYKMSESDAEGIIASIDTRLKYKKLRAARESAEARASEAASEVAAEAAMAAVIARRNSYINLQKRISRMADYEAAPKAGGLPGFLVGLRAKLIGSARAFEGAGRSVEAEARAIHADYVVGITQDFERANLFETMRSGKIDREVARELAELSKRSGGQPGISNSPQALEAAKIIHRYQKISVDRLNQAGAWIGNYDGYIARTAHDADKIRRAKFPAWRDFVLDKLDHERTFADIQDREAFLQKAYDALVSGVHFKPDGMQGFKDPAFSGDGNLAKKLSQSRTLHWKDADAWMDYQAQFGGRTLIENTLGSLDMAARNTALMRTYGTNPRAEFDADIQRLSERWRSRDPEGVRKLQESKRFLGVIFDELDGTANQPQNKLAARIGSGVRTVISMAKLGGVLISSINDTVTKAAILQTNGVGFLDSYMDSLTSIVRGRGKGEEREVLDLLRAGMEGMSRDLAGRFSGDDTLPGKLSKLANYYFKWTGLTYWTDAQRAGTALVLSRHMGMQKGSEWATLQAELKRQLPRWGVGEAEWNALRQVEWKQADGRTYLTPDAALRLTDDQVDALLHAKPAREGERLVLDDRARNEYRQDLALSLHGYIADVGEAAVLNPGVYERALMRQGQQPGTMLGEALRYVGQFKAFPIAMITKEWPRLIHGQDGVGRIAGVVHMLAASVAMGYAAMTAKDMLKGRNPRDPKKVETWFAALAQGGGFGIYGDYLFGEYSRNGRSALASLAGPTFGQIDDLAELYHRARKQGDLGAQALKIGMSNMPFVNMFYAKPIFDYLFIYQLQERMNPGFLRRAERRAWKENEQTYWLPPSSNRLEW